MPIVRVKFEPEPHRRKTKNRRLTIDQLLRRANELALSRAVNDPEVSSILRQCVDVIRKLLQQVEQVTS